MLQSLLHFFTVLLGTGPGQEGAVTDTASLISSAATVTNSPFQSFDFLNTQANITSSTPAKNFSHIEVPKHLEGSFIEKSKGSKRVGKRDDDNQDTLKVCANIAKEKETATQEIVAAKIARAAHPEASTDFHGSTKGDGTSQPVTNSHGLFELKNIKDAIKSTVGELNSQLKTIQEQVDVKGIAADFKKKILPFRQRRIPVSVDFSQLPTSPDGKIPFDSNVHSSFLSAPIPFYGSGLEHDWRYHFAHSHSDGLPEHISPHDHDHKDLHSRNAFEPITGTLSPNDNEVMKHLGFEYTPQSKAVKNDGHYGTVAPTVLPKTNKIQSLAERELDSFDRAFSDKVCESDNHNHAHGHLNFDDYFGHIHDHHRALENTPQSYQSYDWTKILKSLVPSNNLQPPKTCTCTGDMKCCICSDGTCAAPGSCGGGSCSGADKPQTNVELDVVPVVLSPVIVNVFGTNKTGLNEGALKEAEEKVKAMILEKTMNESTLIREVLGKSFPRLLINSKDKKPTVSNVNGGETEIHLNLASHERTR